MLCLPSRFAEFILTFAPVFVQQRTWWHAHLLLLGAILTPGQRTVSSILRLIGLRRERHSVNYHRVLNRAVWNSRQGAGLLLGLLIGRFAPSGPIVLGVDDTIERRRGKRISAKASIAIQSARRSRSSSRPADCTELLHGYSVLNFNALRCSRNQLLAQFIPSFQAQSNYIMSIIFECPLNHGGFKFRSEHPRFDRID